MSHGTIFLVTMMIPLGDGSEKAGGRRRWTLSGVSLLAFLFLFLSSFSSFSSSSSFSSADSSQQPGMLITNQSDITFISVHIYFPLPFITFAPAIFLPPLLSSPLDYPLLSFLLPIFSSFSPPSPLLLPGPPLVELYRYLALVAPGVE